MKYTREYETVKVTRSGWQFVLFLAVVLAFGSVLWVMGTSLNQWTSKSWNQQMLGTMPPEGQKLVQKVTKTMMSKSCKASSCEACSVDSCMNLRNSCSVKRYTWNPIDGRNEYSFKYCVSRN